MRNEARSPIDGVVGLLATSVAGLVLAGPVAAQQAAGADKDPIHGLMGDYVRATFHDGGSVPRIPPWHAGGGLSWEDDTLDMDLMLKYSGRQDHLAFAETPTSGFVSLDMQTTWRPLADHPGVELAVIGHNLTNSVQRDAVSLNKDEVTMPGRNVRLMVRAEF